MSDNINPVLIGAAKPVVSEETVAINERFYAYYSSYINGADFSRGRNSFSTLTKREFIAPTTNPVLAPEHNAGVKFDACEHVSLCLSGNANFELKRHQYTYDESGNLTGDIVGTYNDTVWSFGSNNVENGLGYLPKEQFTRTFSNNYSTCCILPTDYADKTSVYNFEVVQLNNSSTTLNKDVMFVHVAYGSVDLNGGIYNQKQNILNVLSGSTINSSTTSIIILGYIKE